MKDIKQIIANNLIELRKSHDMTQNELADKLKYSDNTISRWERAEITPSVENLQAISELYEIDITDLFKEKITSEMKKDNKKYFLNKLATSLLSVFTIWFIAIILYIYTRTFYNLNFWMFFVWAVPVSCLVLLSFAKHWKNKVYGFVVLSVLIWTALTSIYLQFLDYNVFLIFTVGVPLQAALSIWTFVKKN